MTFRVIVTENAQTNLRHYFERAAAAAPETVAHWINRFHEALASLSERPDHCLDAPEATQIEEEIWPLKFSRCAGGYRVLFTIAGDEVRILHIRRAAMDVASPDEING